MSNLLRNILPFKAWPAESNADSVFSRNVHINAVCVMRGVGALSCLGPPLWRAVVVYTKCQNWTARV